MALLLQETPQPFTEREERPIFQPLPVNRGKFFMKLGLPIAVLGIALGALRQTSVQTILPAATGTEQALAVLAACGALVLVLVTLLALQSASGWNRLFRPLVPFVAVVVFLFPVGGSDGSVISSLALLVGYMSFEAMLWICFGELSQQYRLSPVLVFGAGRGIQAITSLFGSMMPVFAVAWADILPMGNSTVIVILLLAMVFAYALLPSESEIRKLVLDCPVAKLIANDGFNRAVAAQQAASAQSAAEEAAGSEAGDRPNPSAADAPDETPAAREDADAASMHAASSAPSQPDDTTAPNQAARQAAQLEPTASMDTPSAGAGEAAPASSAAAPAAPAASTPAQAAPTSTASSPADDAAARGQSAHVAPTLAATPSAPTAPAPATSPAASAPATSASPAAMGSSSGGSIWPTEKRGRFKRKCEATANRYLLSARETEVLFFLAKGHNATSIQEQLYISEGTTKTHIRHIYRKLDVHSQQELIQIVENAEVD
ncbi:MAG TPA: helix-turn-helix transcriptional regulator [Candidatus Aveggerthella excrementigallinarum]|nr:helix-turn-helix transcriptional regulator [Candidatus Aveggerthella excrementigallinarum]